MKDTFDAVECIKKIPKELMRNNEYTLISLDVVWLFTNVPLRKTLTNGVMGNEEKDKTPTVFVNIGYPGEKDEHLLKKCL